jgi:hypothetical protein
MLRRVVWEKFIDISEEYAATVFRVHQQGKQAESSTTNRNIPKGSPFTITTVGT